MLLAQNKALKDAEDLLVVLGRDAGAVVPHAEEKCRLSRSSHVISMMALRFVVVLDGVADQVVEDLPDANGIADERGKVLLDPQIDMLLLGEG